MQCSICNKNEAFISIQQVSGGTTKNMYICEACAARLGLKAFSTDIDISITNILKKAKSLKKETYSSNIVCPECGHSLNDIQANHKLGCANCFFYFRNEVLQLLKDRKTDLVYTGKIPKTEPEGFTELITIEQLKQKLDAAIEIEDYELAVYFRDKIKELEKKNAV